MTKLDDPVDLKIAIERQHGGTATFVRSEPVTEKWGGKVVWDGIVQVFAIGGIAKATTAYAWSSSIKESKNRRVYAVLGMPPVNSALDAIRAAIVPDQRQKN